MFSSSLAVPRKQAKRQQRQRRRQPAHLEGLERRVLLSSVSFASAVSYPVGSEPYAVAAGNFTSNDVSDLAVVNAADGTVSILLGNGNGTFQSDGTYTVGANPRGVAVGDFAGNGINDLAVVNGGDGTVSILLGNGNGTFHIAVNYAAGGEPNAVAVGDFNGDGKLDLAVADYGDGAVSILLGNGNGTFQSPVEYATGSGSRSLAVGDFNGDGKSDLAVTNVNDGDVSILLGNGDGTFQTGVNYASGNQPNSVVVGDFNGNGIKDLAIANASDNSISILLGYGDGTFQTAVGYATGNGPTTLVEGDFNGSGKLDLATTNEEANSVSVLMGNGNGTFQNAVAWAVGSFPRALAIGDFTGAGNPDLAVANQGSDSVSVLLNTTTASISGSVDATLAGGNGSVPEVVKGLPGVTVYIDSNGDDQLDSNDTAVETDANGNFDFTDLAAGTYQVREMVPNNYAMSTPAAGYLNVTVATGQSVSGQDFLNTPIAAGTVQAVYQLYSPMTNDHLNTTSLAEYNALATAGWLQEGIAFADYNGPATVGGVNAEPLYRLYDAGNQRHLFTTSFNEFNTLRQEPGWNNEGIAGYVFPSQIAATTPLYRLNYPFLADAHLMTVSQNQVTELTSQGGWIDEGIQGYVIDEQLVFTRQPATAAAGATMPAITVAVEDQSGNILTGNTSSVTLAIATATGALGGTVLQGTLTEPVVNGVATIDNVSFSQGGTYTLLASNGVLTPGVSNSVAITGVAVPEYRLYNPGTLDFLYTASVSEETTLSSHGWVSEGTPFQVYNGPVTIGGVSAQPEYRLYDQVNYRHLFTTSFNEANTLGQLPHWTDEGIAAYILPSPVAGSVALYRLSNPDVADMHLLTTDMTELNTLVGQGWTIEGTIGYVLA